MPSTEARLRAAMYIPHGATPDTRGYAPAIVAWNFARAMQGFAPLIVSAREHYPQDVEVVAGIPVHRIHEGRVYRRLFKKATRLDPYPLHARAAAVLAHEPWDLLHAHQLEFPVQDFLRRSGARKPVLLHAHVTTNRFDPARGVADRYIAASDYIRRRLIEAKGYPAERLVIVRNGVDVQTFAPPSVEARRRLRDQLGLPQDASIIAFVGRKQEVKGFHTWLRTVSALLDRHNDLYAVAAGPELDEARREPSYGERQRLRQQLQSGGRFLDLPAMPHAGLAELLRAVDVTLLPSQAEPQGMVMIESMASGCITVSADVGGIPESIRDGETGFLLKRPDDADEAIALCEQVLLGASQWSAMRHQARADIETRFAWEAVTRELEKVYRGVLAGGTTAASS